jgi:hypothetical protein
MNRKVLGIVGIAIIVAVFALCVTACSKDSDDDDGNNTYTLSGTLVKAGADGKYAYGKLVAGPGGSSSATALYSVKSNAFASGAATYSVTDVAPGSYTAWVFIDMNGNGASSQNPDTNDYYASGDVVIGSTDVTLNVPEAGWTLR